MSLDINAWGTQCDLAVVTATRRLREANAHIPQHAVVAMAQQVGWCPAYSTAGDLIVQRIGYGDISMAALKLKPAEVTWTRGYNYEILDRCEDFVDLSYVGVTDLVSRLHEFKQGVSQAVINKAYGEFKQAWLGYVMEAVREITMQQ